jgi:predicted nucleic acid-binding protein
LVLAEFLVFARASAPNYLTKIRETSGLRIVPFDEKAAVELAEIEIKATKDGNKRGPTPAAPWQHVKVDRQIVAIAKSLQARAIYSNDGSVATHARACGVTVYGCADLPEPGAVQIPMPLLPAEPPLPEIETPPADGAAVSVAAAVPPTSSVVDAATPSPNAEKKAEVAPAPEPTK